MVNMNVRSNKKSPTSDASYNLAKLYWYGQNCMKRSTLCRENSFANNPQPAADYNKN